MPRNRIEGRLHNRASGLTYANDRSCVWNIEHVYRSPHVHYLMVLWALQLNMTIASYRGEARVVEASMTLLTNDYPVPD